MKPRSDRITDDKGRWRSKAVTFRLTPEEDGLLADLVALSGLTKQNYITNRLLNRDIVVQGNPRVYKALGNKMAEICDELKRLESCSDISEEHVIVIQTITETMNGLKSGTDKPE